jgi:hypothetical protein
MAKHHEIIAANLAAHRAELRARLGPVLDPYHRRLDTLGHNVYIGQKMLDLVTGQIVEVEHAGVIETSSHQVTPE